MTPDLRVADRDLFIDGVWTAPVDRQYLDVVTPISGEVVGRIAAGSKGDVERAISAAKAAHSSGSWRNKSGSQRGAVLKGIAEAVKQQKGRLARLETIDCGKPIVEAEADMDEVVSSFEYYAGLAEKLDAIGEEDLNVPDSSLKIVVRREPLGVCALITPWNYPLLMAVWKIAPALAAGNTIVLKPSEMASVTCLEFGELCCRAGLPRGVLNVVTGTGQAAGAPLSQSKDVAKVSFTGSVNTGRAIGHAAVENIRPTTLELGGKSPLLVFADALETEEDFEKAVEWTMFGIFWTGGQICSATSRVLVEECAADRFFERLKQRTEEIALGDPLLQETRLGPLVSMTQLEKVLAFVEEAKRAGCRLLTGGRRPSERPKGCFLEPTIFTDVPTDSQLWREEVFGPVLACRTFKSEEEALRIANDTEFGLAAGVLSKNSERCKRLVEQFECGIVWVNSNQLSHISAPWGGVKASGYGRDCGEASLQQYMNLKQVTTWVAEEKLNWFQSRL